MKRTPIWILFGIILAVGACAGRNGSPVLPVGAPAAGAPAAGVPAFGAGHVAPMSPSRRRAGRANFTIRIPMKRNRRGALRPAYISPATESISIAVDSGTPAKINVTPGSPNCALSGGLYTVCFITFQVLAGSHVFSLITYDATNGTGKELSADTNVPFKVVSGSNTPLAVTLGGIPHSLFAFSSGAPHVTGSGTTFSVYGNLPVAFEFAIRDADGYQMLGSGIPTASVSISSPAPLTVSSPNPYAQNLRYFTSSYQPTNPTVPSAVTVTIKASPIPNSGGSTVSTTIHLSLYQPWIYVANQATSTVGISDEAGNPKTVSGAFSHVPDPSGLAYDPHNMWPYIPSIDESFVCVYDVEGNLISLSPYSWQGLNQPYDVAYVNAGGLNRLYVVNNSMDGNAAVSIFDEDGNPQSLPPSPPPFAAAISPRGIAYDSHNGNLYISDDEYDTIYEYTPQGGFVAQFGSSLPPSTYAGITYDPSANLLYAVDRQNSKVVAFDENGSPATLQGTFPNLVSPEGIVYDPYDGLLYVADLGNNVVRIYDEQGHEQPGSGFSSNGTNPWGINVVL